MKKIVFYLICACLLSSCSTTQKMLDQSEFPEWLQKRPYSDSYFIGIGSAKKFGTPGSYMKSARERALADMSQSISVNISSTTSNAILEGRNGLHESYKQSVKAKTTEIFEGVEMVDQFDDGVNYHTFYKIDKATFYRLKEERKEKALTKALSYYNQAKSLEKNGQVARALGNYVEVINSVINYLNESTKIENNGVDVELAYEARNSFDRLVMGLSLSPSSSSFEVKRGEMLSDKDLNFLVEYDSDAVSDIPVTFKYTGGYLEKSKTISNASGEVSTFIKSVRSKRSNERIEAEIDIKSIVRKASNDLFVRKLFTINTPKKQIVNIIILSPSIKIVSSQKNANSVNVLTDALSNSGIEINGGDDYLLNFILDKQEKKLSYAYSVIYSLTLSVRSVKDDNKRKVFTYTFSGEGRDVRSASMKVKDKLDRALKRRISSEVSRFVLR